MRSDGRCVFAHASSVLAKPSLAHSAALTRRTRLHSMCTCTPSSGADHESALCAPVLFTSAARDPPSTPSPFRRTGRGESRTESAEFSVAKDAKGRAAMPCHTPVRRASGRGRGSNLPSGTCSTRSASPRQAVEASGAQPRRLSVADATHEHGDMSVVAGRAFNALAGPTISPLHVVPTGVTERAHTCTSERTLAAPDPGIMMLARDPSIPRGNPVEIPVSATTWAHTTFPTPIPQASQRLARHTTRSRARDFQQGALFDDSLATKLVTNERCHFAWVESKVLFDANQRASYRATG